MSQIFNDLKVESIFSSYDADERVEKYSAAIMDKVRPFIEKNADGVYKVKFYQIYYRLLTIPYVYCWVDIIDSKRFYNGKNKVHNLHFKNPIGLHPTYPDFQLDVKAW